MIFKKSKVLTDNIVDLFRVNLSGVTYKDHKKWKITENQAFSVIFILSETPEIGKI